MKSYLITWIECWNELTVKYSLQSINAYYSELLIFCAVSFIWYFAESPKYHLDPQWVMVEGLVCVDDCWLISGCWSLRWLWHFLKTTLKCASSANSAFVDDFCVACNAVDSILPTEELSKWESVLWNPSTALSTEFLQYSKSFAVPSIICTASSPG